MHIAVGNYWLLAQTGIKPGGAHWPNHVPADAEKIVTAKTEVLRWLKDSLAAVRSSHDTVDGQKKGQLSWSHTSGICRHAASACTQPRAHGPGDRLRAYERSHAPPGRQRQAATNGNWTNNQAATRLLLERAQAP